MSTAPRSGQESPVKQNKTLRTVLRLFVAGAILFLLFRRIPLDNVMAVIHEIRPGWAGAAFLATLAVHAGASLRLQKLCALGHLDWSVREVFQINTAARFYSLFLPAGNFTAIAIRYYRLSAIHKTYRAAIVAMLGDRVMATITLCLVGGIFWFIERPQEALYYWQPGILTLTVLVAGIGMTWLYGTQAISTILRYRTGVWVHDKVLLLRSLAAEQMPAAALMLALLFLLSVLIHVFGILSYILLSEAVGLEVSFAAMGWIRSVVMLSTMLPVSVAGIGLREGAMVMLLGLYDVSPEEALAFSLVVFAVTVVGVGLIGGILEALRMRK